MNFIKILITSLFALGAFNGTAFAISTIEIDEFKTHNFDQAIKQTLGFEVASIIYFSEKASITPDEKALRNTFESVGCYPFYVMKEGQAVESGYDCRTFFCAGYSSGTPQCKDNEGLAFGGSVEINNRLSNAQKRITMQTTIPFSNYPLPKQTQAMKDRNAFLSAVECDFFLIAEFGDVILGDGYTCKEIGRYTPPNGDSYSARNKCVTYWYSGGYFFGKYGTNFGNDFVCDTEFRPNEYQIRLSITKKTAVVSQNLSSGKPETGNALSSSSSVKAPFSDVAAESYGANEIATLLKNGVISGYSDGTFKPINTVNRAELLKLLIVGLHSAEDKAEKKCFPDVADEWFSAYVCAGKRLGWVGGYSSGQFKPANTVNRAEAIKMIVLSLTKELDSSASLPSDVPENAWFAPYVRKAVELGIVIETSFKPTDSLTRADAAIWIYRGTN